MIIPLFENLKNLLIKIFLEFPINDLDLNLKIYETEILKSFLIRKGFKIKNNFFSKSFLNKLSKTDLRKKKEYNLKFVFLKAISYLKKSFLNDKLSYYQNTGYFLNEIINSQEEYFYFFYFGNIAKKLNIPIANFYVFKNWTHRHNKNIPKSITSKSVKLWKQNPDFISDINNYLSENFVNDFINFNKLKISKMISGWDKLAAKIGLENAVKSIIKSLNSKGSKMPWTLSEVKYAINDAQITLNN